MVSEAFRKARTPRDDYPTEPPHDIVDCSNHIINNVDSGLNTRLDSRGIICPQCGRCLARVHYGYWECEIDPGCGLKVIPKKISNFTVAELMKAEHSRYTGTPQPRNLNLWNIPETVHFLDINDVFQTEDDIAPRAKLRMHVYDLGSVVGKVYHIMANEAFRSEKLGPNYLLEAYQQETSKFKRSKMHTGWFPSATSHIR